MRWLDRLREKNTANRKWTIYRELLDDLRFIRENKNSGLLTRRLFNMKGVVWGRTETGWTDYVDVRMNDGYEISARGVHLSKAIRDAAVQVALRWRDRLKG